MKYQVTTIRSAGLEARWTKNSSGAPIIVARNPAAKHEHQKQKWWYVDARMWKSMLAEGVVEAFNRYTLLGDIFSI